MNTRKNLLAAAIAMSLGVSGFAYADQGGDGDPNTNADNDSVAANVTDNLNDNSDNTNNSDNSDNSDNSTDTDVADSFKIAD
ncbi:MAG: hypothetical protein ACQETT_03525, partial [Pseudomonadota bacterium]